MIGTASAGTLARPASVTGHATAAPRWRRALHAAAPEVVGTVRSAVGLVVDVVGTRAAVGDLLTVGTGSDAVPVEVVAAGQDSVRCMPLGPTRGLHAGQPVVARGESLQVPVGTGLLGRVLDGLGRPDRKSVV